MGETLVRLSQGFEDLVLKFESECNENETRDSNLQEQTH